ncbi:MAG: bifunctional nuclease family protein [Armatimonadia bacterium]
MVEMLVHRIGMNQQGHTLVILADLQQVRLLPILIGEYEAYAIALALRGETFERPLTHDLFANALQALGHRLTRVEVTKLENGTFYGLLHLTTSTGSVTLDARPSDAIALALRTNARIFVAEQVLGEAQVWAADLEDDENDELTQFRKIMGNMGLDADEPPADVDEDEDDH